MPIQVNNKNYYLISDICHKTGISHSTILLWLETGKIKEDHYDGYGWKLFSEETLKNIEAESQDSAETINYPA